MTFFDYAIILGFLLVMALVGLAVSRLIVSADDLFVAGRELAPFILCATITATNISMLHFVGMGGTAYQSGVSIAWQNWADALVAGGATLADSPAALAARVEIIFTMLARPDIVEETALGNDGFLAHLERGRSWIDCSTVDPSFSKKMAAEAQARGVRFLGAPVTGSKMPAAQAKLIFWVGGDAADLQACRPLLGDEDISAIYGDLALAGNQDATSKVG